MPEWEIVRLASFEADFEQAQPDENKWEKWINTFKYNPMGIKNAHALNPPLKPLWSAHYNAEITYIVLYLVCNGNPEGCFLKFSFESIGIEAGTIDHVCDKARKRAYLYRMDKHDYRKIL